MKNHLDFIQSTKLLLFDLNEIKENLVIIIETEK